MDEAVALAYLDERAIGGLSINSTETSTVQSRDNASQALKVEVSGDTGVMDCKSTVLVAQFNASMSQTARRCPKFFDQDDCDDFGI
jgi:hypothetical protein